MSDTERLLAAEAPIKIAKAFDAIGVKNGTRYVIANDKESRAAQELFVASELFRLAEKRKENARKEFLGTVKVPDARGNHVIVDTAHVTAMASVRASPSRLNEKMLVNALALRFFKGNVEETQAFVDTCKGGGDGATIVLNVSLRDA